MKTRHISIIVLITLCCINWAMNSIAAKYDSIVEQAQKKLTELGYDPGPIDGKIGKKTTATLKSFQQDNGLTATGELDKATKEKLGIVKKEEPPVEAETPKRDIEPATSDMGKAKRSLKPIGTFTMDKIPMSTIPFAFPLSGILENNSWSGWCAVPEEGYMFFIVALGKIDPETKISPTDLDVSVVGENGTSYKPIAFGFAGQGFSTPITLVGRLDSGEINIVGSPKSFVGVIYTVPKTWKGIKAKLRNGNEYDLEAISNYSPAETAKITHYILAGHTSRYGDGEHWLTRSPCKIETTPVSEVMAAKTPDEKQVDEKQIKENLITAGMQADLAEQLVSTLKLKGKPVQQQKTVLVVGDQSSIDTGNYLIAGETQLNGEKTESVLYIGEYQNGRLQRVDLSDSRILLFEGGKISDFTLVQWDENGQRKYTAEYKAGKLQDSELHLYEFDVILKYNSQGDLTEENLSTVLAGGNGYTCTELAGHGFTLKSRSTGNEESFSTNGRRFFRDTVGQKVKEFDHQNEITLRIAKADNVAGHKINLLDITKEHVSTLITQTGEFLKITTKSGVLGDDANQVAEKGIKDEVTGNIQWTPTPLTILNPDEFCEIVFAGSDTEEEITDIYTTDDQFFPVSSEILEPPLQLFTKTYKGNQWSRKNIEEQLSAFESTKNYLSNDLNSGVKTGVCIKENQIMVVKYTDGQPGYRLDWEARAVKVSNRQVIVTKTFIGGDPPSSKNSNLPAYGEPPKAEFQNWLRPLIKMSEPQEPIPTPTLTPTPGDNLQVSVKGDLGDALTSKSNDTLPEYGESQKTEFENWLSTLTEGDEQQEPIPTPTLTSTPIEDQQIPIEGDLGEALLNAAKNGDLAQVQVLLNEDADVNAKDKNHKTALMWAAVKGHTDVVKLLLDSGASVHIKTMIGGKTALQYATDKGHTEIIRLLRETGAKE